ncbi:MAG: HEPN domain-containing protein [Candidatus Diapherotrites archaeon]
MKIQDCIRKGWLKREEPNSKKAEQSIKISEAKLEEAEKALKADLIETTIVFSYMSMFHAARALLFKEGFREKGHVPILVFLEEKYEKIIGKQLLYEFNSMRLERHESLYGLQPEYFKDDAEHALKTARQFLSKIKELI